MQYGERSGEEAAKYLWKRSSGGRWSEIKLAAAVPGFSCPQSVWGRRMGMEGSLNSQTGVQIHRPAVQPRFPRMPGDLDSASWRTSVRRASLIPLRGGCTRSPWIEAGRRRQEDCGGESFSDGKGKGRTHAPSPIPLEGGEVCAPRSHYRPLEVEVAGGPEIKGGGDSSIPRVTWARRGDCDMGWPDLLSKLAVMVMMMIDNLVSPMISPR
jgi:hypothetical protein